MLIRNIASNYCVVLKQILNSCASQPIALLLLLMVASCNYSISVLFKNHWTIALENRIAKDHGEQPINYYRIRWIQKNSFLLVYF